jgi:predicted ATP-grasp superfamily ATP-dependent carboligase
VNLHRVLVLSATASAVNMIKSLRGEPDISLFVTDANRYASGLYEDGVTALILPRARELDAYKQALDLAIDHHGIEILLPTSDHDVAAVVRLLSNGWNPPVAVFRPSLSAQRTLADKGAIADRLSSSGIAVPRTWRSQQDVELPAVVKPAQEGGSKGVTIVRDRRQLATSWQRCTYQYGPDVIAQEYIPGGLGSTYVSLLLYDDRGACIIHTAMRSSLTYYTWGGGGNAGYLVDEPTLADLSQRIIAAAGGWRGAINLEFRRHYRSGQFYFMEANCRLNGYSYLTTMNELNYPRLMVDLLLGKRGVAVPRDRGSKNFVLGFREKLVERWVD